MNSTFLINKKSQFSNLELLNSIFMYNTHEHIILFGHAKANGEDPDQKPYSVVS